MASETIPVNKDVIAWARKRSGLSLPEASERFPKIAAWEAGEVLPTYPQLEAMADAFRIPVAVFFFPTPPDVPPISESFRTLPTREFEQLPSRMQHLLRKAKAYQISLSELCQGRNPSERQIVRDLAFSADVSIDAIATEVRDYLGVPMNEQQSWRDDDEALKRWRQALLKVGIFVFKDAFREDGYSGFSLYDDLFPIIYVNNSSSKTRQIFTLFHELAHILVRTSGIDPVNNRYADRLPAQQRQIEIWCDRFAAELLLPESYFDVAFAGMGPTETTAEVLATRFHVSREFIFRRFLDRGLIDGRTYDTAAAKWTAQRRTRSGGNPYWAKISYLGREYVALAFSQYHQNRIDELQLSEYLDSKPRNLSTLEDYFLRGAQ